MMNEPTHKWLHESCGFTISDFGEAHDFEALIGELNGVLGEQYGCQIVYDRDVTKNSDGCPSWDTNFNGFAIFVKEKQDDI
jgi:hypothetical protein